MRLLKEWKIMTAYGWGSPFIVHFLLHCKSKMMWYFGSLHFSPDQTTKLHDHLTLKALWCKKQYAWLYNTLPGNWQSIFRLSGSDESTAESHSLKNRLSRSGYAKWLTIATVNGHHRLDKNKKRDALLITSSFYNLKDIIDIDFAAQLASMSSSDRYKVAWCPFTLTV